MTIPYAVETTLPGRGAVHWTTHLCAKVLSWVGAVVAQMACRSRATAATLDDMSEAQLEEIGMERIVRKARWLDCHGSSLSMDFEYHGRPSDIGRNKDAHV